MKLRIKIILFLLILLIPITSHALSDSYVDKVYKTNHKSSSVPSTVIMFDGLNLKILREGEIKEKDLKEALK